MAYYNGPSRTDAEMLAEFRLLKAFQGFASPVVDDEIVIEYINIAKMIFSVCERATLYLTGYLLADYIANADSISLDKTGGASVSDATVGQVKASFVKNTSVPEDADLAQSDYGRMYIRLRDVCPRYAFASGVTNGSSTPAIYGGV
jgi:hypothetical protein